MRILRAALTLALCLAVGPAVAQPTPEQPMSRAAFERAFDDYKTFMREFEELRVKFQTATPAEREQLNAQASELVETAKPKVDAMVSEALKLYVAAPEQDEEIATLLANAAAHKLVGSGGNAQGGDQYEQALEILRPMLENGNQAKAIASMGVVAAFCCNEFDLVDKYAAMADERGEDPAVLGEGLARSVAEYSNPGLREQYRKLWEQEKSLREAEETADNLPRIKFQTTSGDVVIELFEDQAPIATASMINLVKNDFYSGVVFHRVLPHFMAQGGDPTGSGAGGPGYSIPCECYQDDARMHFRGSLSMAHAGRDSGGSQFFLTFVPTYHLNGKHTVFGRVVEGMEVLGELRRIEPGERGVEPSKILSATVLRDRGHEYAFEKLPGR